MWFIFFLLFTSSASAFVDEAARHWQTDPVYLHPKAQVTLSSQEVTQLQQAARGRLTYIAILPDSAGDPIQVLRESARQFDRPGTFAVIVGNRFRAASTIDTLASRRASQAFERYRDQGPFAVLMAFVESSSDSLVPRRQEEHDNSGFWSLLLIFGVGFLAVYLFSKRQKRKESRKELEQVRALAQEDLMALGDDIRALDLDVSLPQTPQAVKDDYHRALQSYERANRVLETTNDLETLQEMSKELEEGRYFMSCAQRRLEGKPILERRAPCFFDPRHGPSVSDIHYTPLGGAPRAVPACQACVVDLEQGNEPSSRHIDVHGQSMPYYMAPPSYQPYYGGYFGGFGLGNLVTGFALGSMLTHAFDHDAMASDYSGDFGGGDFGGGDFGGGDFGGSDFGGGDFGGGDF